METLTKRQVVLFFFPYTNLLARKLRPCLVLSDPFHDDVLLCQITSQNLQKDICAISLTDKDFEEGSLYRNSFVRANMLFTATSSQVQNVVGVITKEKYNEIIFAIKKFIELH